jgi:hypothetical protein
MLIGVPPLFSWISLLISLDAGMKHHHHKKGVEAAHTSITDTANTVSSSTVCSLPQISTVPFDTEGIFHIEARGKYPKRSSADIPAPVGKDKRGRLGEMLESAESNAESAAATTSTTHHCECYHTVLTTWVPYRLAEIVSGGQSGNFASTKVSRLNSAAPNSKSAPSYVNVRSDQAEC